MANFEHWIVEGPPENLTGFVRGWAAGAAVEVPELERMVVWAEEWEIDLESFREHLVEILRSGAVTHVLVRSDASDRLRRALVSHGGELRLRKATPIAAMHFEFEFEILARPEAAAVRALFDSTPPGVTITWKQPPSETQESGGAGMYAPSHAYRLHGRGTASGDVEGILSLHLRCRQHERIHQRPIQLQTT
jgi:hypothetical protein